MNINNGILIETDMGLAFEINIPIGSPLFLNKFGDSVTVYTELVLRENDISLYGFHNIETLDFFNLLTTVSGIGPKAAMSILSSLSIDDLRRAISTQDSNTISKANGIGKKTADRLVLELKDKVDFNGSTTSNKTINYLNSEKEIALQALLSLGYSKQEANNALDNVKENDLKSDQYIKLALKNLF